MKGPDFSTIGRDVPDCRTMAPAKGQNRWAVILAGGDGTRLRDLTRLISGDDRPKQFCPLLGEDTLLTRTLRRAQRSVSENRVLVALTLTHRDFYLGQLDGLERTRIVQPANRGTAPPIVFGVLSIARMDNEAVVAVLPSDHHYSDETAFTRALDAAFEIAAERPESLVLLGAPPHEPETEYGWIELGPRVALESGEARRVHRFWEKPPLEVARRLFREDSAWNTFVMVGRARAFMTLSAQAIPDVLEAIGRCTPWRGSEARVEEWIYDRLRACDFSHDVLSREARSLLALNPPGLGWSDLGCPRRVLAIAEGAGIDAPWRKRWMQRKPLREERHQGTLLSHREVAVPSVSPNPTPLPVSAASGVAALGAPLTLAGTARRRRAGTRGPG